ncbi:MAG: flagellar basal body-associated FliL family protein [Defluviitaleaceae bacterium]|nr:flagellar basal body-associated FliL family protein [Defluviitaleaceae bacterium]
MDKSKLMMFIIIALLVLLLGAVVGTTLFLIGLVGDDSPSDFHAVYTPAPPPNLSRMDMVEVPLGSRFSTNLAVSADGRSGAVAAEVILGVNNTGEQVEVEAFIEALEERLRMAQGIAIDVLGDLTYEQVSTVEGRNAAAEEIMIRLQTAFATNLIILVEFSDWFVSRGR